MKTQFYILISLWISAFSSVKASPSIEQELSLWIHPNLASYFPDIKIPYQDIKISSPTTSINTLSGTTLFLPSTKSHEELYHHVTLFILNSHLGEGPNIEFALNYADLKSWLLETIKMRGICQYIASQGQHITTRRETARVPTLIERREVEDIAFELRELWQSFAAGELSIKDVKSQLITMEDKEEALTLMGTFMAKTIETASGKAAITKISQQNGESFYKAYESTRPGALLLFPIPAMPRIRHSHPGLAQSSAN